ncbi:MAG: GNAT family N-acetyltransferase [Anaerolineales bacterium]|jgi:GNAT superfamily N-acetyltransferase
MDAKINIRRISAEQARPLRQIVLRPGQPEAAVTYPGDDAPETLHLGAYLEDKLIGVASVFLDSNTMQASLDAWRLRGMGVLEHFQGQGIGRALLQRCITYIASRGGTSLWCNARTPVLGFYLAMGFTPSGSEFHIPGAGPHYFMSRPIELED